MNFSKTTLSTLVAFGLLSTTSLHAGAEEMLKVENKQTSHAHHHHDHEATEYECPCSGGAHDHSSVSVEPATLMGAHMHGQGNWMFSYSLMHMKMGGNLQGDDDISAEAIATTQPNRFSSVAGQPSTLRVVPDEMSMNCIC